MERNGMTLSPNWLEDTLFVTLVEGGNWYAHGDSKSILIDILNPLNATMFAAVRRGRIIFDFVLAKKFPDICPWRFDDRLYMVDTKEKER